MTNDVPHLPVGATLAGGKYRIVRFIGAGGFGCTYEAEFPDMGIRVAIKEFYVGDFCDRDATGAVSVVSKNKTALIGKLREKFVREAQRLYKMQHPNIVRVSDILHENGTSYYVMDYIDGRSLQGLIEQDGPLPEARALRYIGQVMDALEYVHGQSMLHLDIKPDNIMIDSKDRAILIDFGVSKQYDEVDGHNTSTILGMTPGYAPPEQGDNSIQDFTPAADIYALGATLYTALTGIVPPSAAKLTSGSARLAPPPAGTSASTKNAIAQMMQPNLKRRPQSIAAARALLSATPPPPPPPPPPPGGTKTKLMGSNKSKSKKWLWAAIAGVAVVAVAGVCLLILSKSGPRYDVEDATPEEIEVVQGFDAGETMTIEVPGTGVSFDMIYVEGGTFKMGDTAPDTTYYAEESDERPVHSVTLSDYWIGQTEVTQELWQAVMGANSDWSYSDGLGSKFPAYYISYTDCQEFIRKLNDLTGQHFRMPTEAEWEYAARGGSKSRDYIFSGGNTLGEVGWYDGNSGSTTHPVATKSPNELGIYDMSGNVLEWCSDWYGSYSSASQTNPTGPSTGSDRVYRGGSWSYYAVNCRAAYRDCDSPGFRYCNLGLRLAL